LLSFRIEDTVLVFFSFASATTDFRANVCLALIGLSQLPKLARPRRKWHQEGREIPISCYTFEVFVVSTQHLWSLSSPDISDQSLKSIIISTCDCLSLAC
jgi:hypothetical protein